ncbi:MAG: imidazole glycerol phosphate synthase subunit HisH [Clostridia bacterium]|nr:imidazole glycerol phosphate synthase subunit HisH [Clostridia bacterium]
MVCVVDYGAGNLRNVAGALKYLGERAAVTDDPKKIKRAGKVILPGVGSFGDAMRMLNESGLSETVRNVALSGKPFLGICLGMQLLFEASDEAPGVEGLGVFKGKFRKFEEDREKGIRVPQIGWNSLDETYGFFDGFKGKYVYFVHSFYLPEEEIEKRECIGAETSFGKKYICAVQKDNIIACQFHPEKSGETGIKMLEKFLKL